MNTPLPWFDANCRLGYWVDSAPGTPVTAADLLDKLAWYGIPQALVYHTEAAMYTPEIGNQQLMHDIKDYPALLPCWVLLPHQSGEVSQPAETIAALLAAGVRAVRMFPNLHCFSFRLWNNQELLELLAKHRLPLWVDFGVAHWGKDVIDWEGLHEICAALPDLPVVLVRPHIAANRRLFALMEAYPNLYIETSYYTVHRGIELVCSQFGAERLLFGSGFPECHPGAAITALAYSLISQEDRQLVGGGNLRRLLEQVLL